MRPFAFCCGTGDEREPRANILHHPWPALVAFPRFLLLSHPPAEGSRPETNCEELWKFLQILSSLFLSLFFVVLLVSIHDYRA